MPVKVKTHDDAPPLHRTYFAAPERAGEQELADEIEGVAHNPVVDGLMYVANGLFAVLNEHRQIVALNESFLKLMGVGDSSAMLGLRPGEYVNCIHACDMPDGCGTSPYCASCGAVISIVSALSTGQPHEGTCSITVERDNKEVDLFFQVRCCPITVESHKFILMFMNDISIQQQRANLEMTFFHDINNLLTGLLGKSDIFQLKGVWDTYRFGEMQKLIRRTVQEFSMQQALANSMAHTYQPLYCTVSVNSILEDLRETFDGHPLCRGRNVLIPHVDESLQILTDPAIVDRVLVNMITNALEATEMQGTVKAYIEEGGNSISFCVWNNKQIPDEYALRIFKRNFTTKNGLGHGLGTYSMKFFGEKVLGGMVDFTSSEENGTTFRLALLN